MISRIEEMKKQLNALIEQGKKILYGFAYDTLDPKQKKQVDKFGKLDFVANYENWYSEAHEFIRQILPSRLEDFKHYYKEEKRKVIDPETYSIRDALLGLTTNMGLVEKCNPKTAIPKLQAQILILSSVERKFESILFDIRHIVQADLFDSELEAARALNDNGFSRAGGAVAGVVLEGHLIEVCNNHSIVIKKKNPSINDLNQILKDNDILEQKDWRFIQHLGDIRNLCDHKKTKEPTNDDINDLINGVEKITKTIL